MARKPKSVDHRSFRVTERRTADGKAQRYTHAEKAEGYWWACPRPETAEDEKAPPGTVHSSVWAAVDSLEDQQAERRKANETHARLYGDRDSAALKRSATEDKVTLNVVRMAIDTLCAKISKAKPKTAFVTDGGNWGMQRKAKRLDKFVTGVLYKARAHTKARDAFRDATVFDVGVLKFTLEGEGICVERVHPGELMVDEVDGQYGEPRCLYQRKAIPREMVKSLWPDFAAAVDTAAEPEALDTRLPDSLGDVVEVREAWHLPSGPDAGDGRHVIAISNATLLDEEWARQDFPFVFFRFSKRLAGFYGCGVAEQLVGRQRSLNRKLRSLNECLRIIAVPRTFIEETSEVNPQHITTEAGTIIKYRGTPPHFPPAQPVPPELFRAVEDDVRQALEVVGVSKLDVAAQKPGGLDSRAALREFNDIASERFVLVGQMYEEAWPEMARQVISLAKQAAEEGEPLEAVAEGRRGMERIAWNEVDLDADAFILKALPTSSLPSSPHARLQAVQEWLEMGWIDGMTARRLMDMPDLESANSVAFAGQEDIEDSLEDLLDGGDYRTPEPYQDLAYGLKRFQSAYLRVRRMGAPEDVLDNLRTWMLEAEAMLSSTAQTPAQPGPAAAPALPAGAPPAPGAPPLAA